jgi:hypothetical protein
MVINDNAFVVIDNSAFIVLQEPTSNGLLTAGTGGNLVSEAEFDRVLWNIGTSTGTYILPYSTAAGVKFPLTVDITGAGVGAGTITFSTYMGAIWDNDTYRPSDVTHMLDYATGSVNNSAEVIDRFWMIDALGYGTRPTVTMSFGYIDAEHSAVGNTITEANLGAQRFNAPAGLWGDFLPVGTANTAANVVTGVSPSPADFYRSWTLVDNTSPLPIELLSFQQACEDNVTLLTWSTASEVNNKEFRIEKSVDGINFTTIGLVPGNGTTNLTSYYSYTDHSSVPGQYYRVIQVDDNLGSETVIRMIYSECNGNGIDAKPYYANNEIGFLVMSGDQRQMQFEVYDAMGQLVVERSNNPLIKGINKFPIQEEQLASACYFIKIKSEEFTKTIKLIVK